MQEELIYDIALSRIDGIGSVMYRQLINTFGSSEEVFNASSPKLMKIPNLGKVVFNHLKKNIDAFLDAKEIVTKSNELGIRIVNFNDLEYPERLKNIYEAPTHFVL